MITTDAFDETRSRLSAAGLAGDWVSRDGTTAFDSIKGAYVLMIRLDRPLPFRIARTGGGTLPAGTYLYTGSAFGGGGLGARLARHFRQDKKIHWHVDRLTLAARDLAALAVEDGNECELVTRLLAIEGIGIAAEGFGSSDCRACASHLLAAR